ncbi:MAG: hypothetical protein ACTSP4_09940 [Candidatus Hodarchaeales archaeon]
MHNALKGKYGRPVVSNYIIDEVLTLARARTGKCDCGKAILDFVRLEKDGVSLFLEIVLNREMIKVTEEYYAKFCNKELYFTDCSILAIMNIYKIGFLVTLAKEFKGLVTVFPK